ncbi:hypothetical protein F4604DRAFT_1934015 [Suillus subluteus]|nr:hypothetical protein F4604DRAFT_1934015 [Suillus subluteus]
MKEGRGISTQRKEEEYQAPPSHHCVDIPLPSFIPHSTFHIPLPFLFLPSYMPIFVHDIPLPSSVSIFLSLPSFHIPHSTFLFLPSYMPIFVHDIPLPSSVSIFLSLPPFHIPLPSSVPIFG